MIMTPLTPLVVKGGQDHATRFSETTEVDDPQPGEEARESCCMVYKRTRPLLSSPPSLLASSLRRIEALLVSTRFNPPGILSHHAGKTGAEKEVKAARYALVRRLEPPPSLCRPRSRIALLSVRMQLRLLLSMM